MALIIKGHKVKIVLASGMIFQPPDDFCFSHDPTGELVGPCVVLVSRYADPVADLTGFSSKDVESARNYFGKRARLLKATVDLPRGPWSTVGDAVEILYVRKGHGRRRGGFHHPFRERFRHPVSLEESADGLGYRLVLPDGCKLDQRGFVWP